MKEQKEYYSLNLNASEVIDVFTNETFIEYSLGKSKLDIKSIEVKKDNDNKLYLKLSGAKDNKKVTYDVYEFEVFEVKDNKKVFDKKWTDALRYHFNKVFDKSFIIKFNNIYNLNEDKLTISL